MYVERGKIEIIVSIIPSVRTKVAQSVKGKHNNWTTEFSLLITTSRLALMPIHLTV
jgi:hypothetical protein